MTKARDSLEMAKGPVKNKKHEVRLYIHVVSIRPKVCYIFLLYR